MTTWTRQIRPVLSAVFLLISLSTCPCDASLKQIDAQPRPKIGQNFVPADFNHTYAGTISREASVVYGFNYTRQANETDAIRVTVSSKTAQEDNPMLVVIKQQLGVLSWQIPVNIEGSYPFWTASRTLCPTINYHNSEYNGTSPSGDVVTQDLFVDLSTSSLQNVDFTFLAYQVEEFFIVTNRPMIFNVSPSEPQYVEYEMPNDTDSVLVTMEALEPEKFCSYFSIQPVRCPVADVESELRIEGSYQTVTSQGAIVVTRQEYPKFYIVVTVKPIDIFCQEMETIMVGPKNTSASYQRIKTVRLLVEKSLNYKGYLGAIFACVGFFTGFYFITCVLLASNIVKWKYCFGRVTEERANQPDVDSHGKVLDALEKDIEGSPVPDPNGGEETAGTSIRVDDNVSDGPVAKKSAASSADILPRRRRTVNSGDDDDDDFEDNDDGVDYVEDAEDDKNIVRTKKLVYVADLTRKSRKRLAKKDRQYRWSMITICIFYGLPVAQLVITYQHVLRNTGNEDLCYYNFECANPLGLVSDFNHVISNIGYVMLGLLFMLLVRRRQLQFIKSKMEHPVVAGQEKGIPSQFGLYYAMGMALIMEGLMSASYHICPSYSNFQFDTSFMYLIGGLGMLKLYQTRHPDILPNAYMAYAFFAFIILMAVLGVIYINIAVWIAFSVFLILLTLGLSAQIYYLGRWKLDFGIFSRTYQRVCSNGFFTWPVYKDRFILLSLVILVNWSLAIMGPIFQPTDFASYLLFCFVTNFVLYVMFYILMKLRCGERISRLTLLFILFSSLTWAGSLYMFYNGPVDWQKTPSRSREVNKPCILLDFYDKHDIWHIMSACSLFFSFMMMMTLDDDLQTVLRTEIVVF